MTASIAPGIYFQMDEEEYHSAPALSSGGIKSLLVTPMNFWANCRWLNPDWEPKNTEFLDLGKAYDTRITVGKAAFDKTYASELDPALYPNALKTKDDLSAAIAQLGGKVLTKWSKADLAKALLALDPTAEIMDIIEAGHAARHQGKTLLYPKTLRLIETAAAMIEKHPDLCKAFTNGYPQVSIFWIDDKGILCKCRTDYLKYADIVDLKTVSNPQERSFDRAVIQAMANYKYPIQATFYMEGVEAAKKMLRTTRGQCAFGTADQNWLQSFMNSEEHRFVFVFQQTGPAPVARGYQFPRSSMHQIATMHIERAKELYLECTKTFGTMPWVDQTRIRVFDDLEFPIYASEV